MNDSRRRRCAVAALILLACPLGTVAAFTPKGSTSSTLRRSNPLARFTKSNNSSDDDVPPSQIESITSNAKLLQPFGSIMKPYRNPSRPASPSPWP